MKHIKIYDFFKNSYDWKVGDVVIAIKGHSKIAPLEYYSDTGRLIENYKYTIIEIIDTTKNEQKPERFQIAVKDENGDNVKYSHEDKLAYFYKSNFITEEEFEMKNNVKKYNI
jgi:hypothetical protein